MRAVFLAGIVLLSAHCSTRKVEPFPETDTVTGRAPIEDFRREWYTSHLTAMGETALPNGAGEAYRFLWLRSFDHPIAVRVHCSSETCRLTGVRTSGKGGYEPGSIAERTSRALSTNEVRRFRELLARLPFWGPQPGPPVSIGPDGTEFEIIGVDGAQWILEGRRGATYHLWDIWSPRAAGAESPFRELCLYLVRLAGLAVRETEIY